MTPTDRGSTPPAKAETTELAVVRLAGVKSRCRCPGGHTGGALTAEHGEGLRIWSARTGIADLDESKPVHKGLLGAAKVPNFLSYPPLVICERGRSMLRYYDAHPTKQRSVKNPCGNRPIR
jgi:hypothetical protein